MFNSFCIILALQLFEIFTVLLNIKPQITRKSTSAPRNVFGGGKDFSSSRLHTAFWSRRDARLRTEL